MQQCIWIYGKGKTEQFLLENLNKSFGCHIVNFIKRFYRIIYFGRSTMNLVDIDFLTEISSWSRKERQSLLLILSIFDELFFNSNIKK
jgi:hypothetical protein